MKRTTRAFLWLTAGVGAAVGGAWAWANRSKLPVDSPCPRPTPTQLDAFGKALRMRITITGTNTLVGDAQGVEQAVYNATTGMLQSVDGTPRYAQTKQLCAYVIQENVKAKIALANQVRQNL